MTAPEQKGTISCQICSEHAKLSKVRNGVLAPQIELSEGRSREQKCKTRLPWQPPARVWVLEARGALWTLWRMTLEGKNDQK